MPQLPRWPRFATYLAIAVVSTVLIAAVAFRVVALDRFPGLNGDEAYYPVILTNLRDGRPQPLITGSGLPLNPLYAVPVYLLHFGHPTPSFVLVRLPALLSGLLALILAYPLLARATDRWTALHSTLLLACLPIAIAYSRFGWDQSQAPLVGLLCVFFAIREKPVGLAIAYLFAVWVHPANVFLAPVLLGPVALRDLRAWRGRPRTARSSPLIPWVLLLAVVAAGVLAWRSEGIRQLVAPLASRLVDINGWGRFAIAVGDLLSGATIYRFVAGEPPVAWVWAERSLFWILLVGVAIAALPRWIRSRELTWLGLTGGALVALVSFYLLIGEGGVSPGWERYAMWLVTPACLIGALLVSSLGDSPLSRAAQLGGVLIVCGLMLTSFYSNYFKVLDVSGGAAARAFRTGTVEPKQAAFESIVRMSRDETAEVTVLSEDWWSFYPIRYLAAERPSMQVVWPDSDPSGDGDTVTRRRRFAVGFVEGPFERWIARHAPELPRHTVPDSAGRPVLHVWDLGYRQDLHSALVGAASIEKQR